MNTRFFHASPARARLALLGGLLAAAAGAQAQVSQGVLWDGFRGQPRYVPAGASFDPRYDNMGNQRRFIDNLVAFGTTAANINDAIARGNVGQAGQIDFTQAGDGLCDVGARPGSPACQKGLLGMMLYTVMLFPDPGTYTLTFAHNDNVLLNAAAPGTAAANYRTLAYGAEVGYWNVASLNDTQYRNANTGAGTITTTTAGEMVPVRIAWNNWGNEQWLRMRWRKPDGTVETVPAANLFNPASLALNAANDTLSQPPGGTSVGKVIDNDTVGSPSQGATLGAGGNARVSPDGAWPAGVSLNADGTVTVAPGTPPATHTLSYRLCHASHPLCTTAQITLTINNVVPGPDSGHAPLGTPSTPIANIAGNDTIHGAAANLDPGTGNATVATQGTWPLGVTLDTATGAISTTAATPAGTHVFLYQLCDRIGPVCSTGTITLTVAAAATVTAVPTLGHWGLMLTGLLAAGLGARRLRRR